MADRSAASGEQHHSVPERFVLVRPGALGDTLLALPALALLRQARPAAHVTLVARRDVLALARVSGLAEATYAYDLPLWTGLFDEGLPVSALVQEVLSGSTAVAWLVDHNGVVATNLRRLGAQQVAGPLARLPVKGEHVALSLARMLAEAGLMPPTTLAALAGAAELRPAPDDVRIAADHLRQTSLSAGQPVVALHAGSGGAAKRWPPAAFAALARALRTRGIAPLLIEGPQDADLTAAILGAAEDPTFSVVRQLGLGALVALLRRCAAYAGNDSGVTHLAALAGVPTLTLFGPTDPAAWQPLGRCVRVLRAPSGRVADLAVTSVLEAVCALCEST
jgi:heptosyltransferase-3